MIFFYLLPIFFLLRFILQTDLYIFFSLFCNFWLLHKIWLIVLPLFLLYRVISPYLTQMLSHVLRVNWCSSQKVESQSCLPPADSVSTPAEWEMGGSATDAGLENARAQTHEGLFLETLTGAGVGAAFPMFWSETRKHLLRCSMWLWCNSELRDKHTSRKTGKYQHLKQYMILPSTETNLCFAGISYFIHKHFLFLITKWDSGKLLDSLGVSKTFFLTVFIKNTHLE